ncbi:PREDICTED: protein STRICTOSIDINE SYNTHASE-LIKE 8-like [Tarenaya hassleriana]|uniref:protein STRICTOSIDINE SYNTHASE-LIKE 8-like n=1 Tax=Tarenaya hassleriana TaxID=28532 RepID=UPI00053C7464|nr:PREDICTED: protein STRICTOSIDINE SYNTHASE-LIKE 8-like [Tarenaya hassleriana]
MVTTSKMVAVAVAVIAVVLVLVPYMIGPPTLSGSAKVLHTSKAIEVTGEGPESLDWDPQGEGPYVGVSDGRVLKWLGYGRGWSDFAFTSPDRENCSGHVPEREHICGRPLGVHFEKKSGDLYIADCYFGIMKVGPEGGLAQKVVDEADGRKFTFTNHMDIDEVDDVIYFTDSSDTYQIRTVLEVFVTGDKTGRLIRYDMKTKETKVLMTGLGFANGVTLSKDRSFVLVAEPPAAKIHRYWLRGPKAGTHDVFVELPGYPDNIRRNEKGEIWAALHCKKTLFSRIVVNYPAIGKFLVKTMKKELIWFLFEGGKPHATIVKVAENGEILENLEDSEGERVKFMSEAYEKDGKLWIGSFILPNVWVYDLK